MGIPFGGGHPVSGNEGLASLWVLHGVLAVRAVEEGPCSKRSPITLFWQLFGNCSFRLRTHLFYSMQAPISELGTSDTSVRHLSRV